MAIKYLRNDITSTRKAIKEIDINKQDKLIPGTGITIDENNVISVSGGGTTAAEYHTTQYYYEHRTTVYPEGAILVYSDYRQDEQGNNIPGVKIGDGQTMVQHLQFITEQADEAEQKADEAVETANTAQETASEAQETASAVQAVLEEKEASWDNKATYEDEITDETLVFSRN